MESASHLLVMISSSSNFIIYCTISTKVCSQIWINYIPFSVLFLRTCDNSLCVDFFYYSLKFSSNNGSFTDHSRMYPTITTKLLTAGPHWELWEMEVSMLVGDHQDLKRYSECPLSIQIVGNSVFHVHLKLPLMESTDTSIPYPCKVCHAIFDDSEFENHIINDG